MSWIRDHFYEFVFPAFLAAEQDTAKIGEPFDVKPAESAPKNMPAVLRKLWTLCAEHKVDWSWDVREVNTYGGTSKYRERAALHQKVLRATLDSAIAALKHEHCPRLFLGGRDVWTFAVLCERRRIPYMFVPELSRTVASDNIVKPFLEERGFEGNELFLDTGFAGSIPRNLEAHFGKEFKFRLMSQGDKPVTYLAMVDCVPGKGPLRKVIRKYKRPNQLFPNRAKAREEALETEYLAKYWKTGTVIVDVEQLQRAELSDLLHLLRSNKKLCRVTLTTGSYLYDFESFVKVPDPYSLPAAVMKWWETLPAPPMDVRPKQRVAQFFSSKAAIQRAALLTAQLWYGIPYWKQKEMDKPKLIPKSGWKQSITDWSLPGASSTTAYTITSDIGSNCSHTSHGTDIWFDTESTPLTYSVNELTVAKKDLIEYQALQQAVHAMAKSKKWY